MDELKPCLCGCDRFDIEYAQVGPFYGCLIGCMNIDCEQPPIIKMALSKKRAYKKAVNAWNRRVNYGTDTME